MLKACGANDETQLNEKSNNRNECGDLIISPPLTVNINASQISSLSIYLYNSVLITTGGELQAIGHNNDGSISRSLPLKNLPHFTPFIIKDNAGRKCNPISAYAGSSFTLYLVSIEGLQGTYLALASPKIMSKYPTILKTSSTNLVGIFGSNSFAAAIDSEGSLFFICTSIEAKQIGVIEATKLPNKEKAVSVSCCGSFAVALSESGNVFISQTTFTQSWIFVGVNEFKIVNELKGKRIKQISGLSNCLAVSEDGKVFGYGRNNYFSLGMKDSVKYEKFTEITTLKNYKITDAYAGLNHSLFRTNQGKLLACGDNTFGQLAIKEIISTSSCSITETIITSGATFCILGDSTTYIFINCDAERSPNRRVDLSLKKFTKKPSTKPTAEPTIKKLEADEEIAKLKTEVASLKKENTSMKTENSSLKTEVASLKKENEKLKKENSSLKTENSSLKEENSSLKTEVASTKEKNESSKNLAKEQDNKKMKASKMKIYDAEEIDSMTHLDSIGRGGQSEVVKVSSPVIYAMKILDTKKRKQKSKKKSIIQDTNDTNSVFEMMKRFIQEYEIMNGLDHRNIIKAYGIFFGDETHQPCIILEFCPNNLCDVVEDQTPFEKVTCIYEISCAMNEVHSHGMIHRDLKPENILIDDAKHVKVSDFGVSCIVDISTQSKTSGVGTLKFMAPELLSENTHYDEKVDVYSFGVVLFYILTDGELPKISITDTALGKKAKIPSNINKVSRDLINRCWSFQANERPSFAEIVEYIVSNKFKLIDGVEKKIGEIYNFLSI